MWCFDAILHSKIGLKLQNVFCLSVNSWKLLLWSHESNLNHIILLYMWFSYVSEMHLIGVSLQLMFRFEMFWWRDVQIVVNYWCFVQQIRQNVWCFQIFFKWLNRKHNLTLDSFESMKSMKKAYLMFVTKKRT